MARHLFSSTAAVLSSLILLVLLSPHSHLVDAQSCGVLTEPTCSSVVPVGSVIFVPPGFADIHALEIFTNRFANLLNIGNLVEPCRSYGLQNLCGTWLRPCHIEGNVTIPVPREVCQDVCQRTAVACSVPEGPKVPLGTGLYFPPGFGPPLNCTTGAIVDTQANNITYYPNGSQVVEYQGVNYTVPCSQSTPVQVPVPVYCQEPLVSSSTALEGQQICAFTCPLPALTDSQYESAKIMQGIMGWFSWAGSGFLVFSLLLYPRTREFPRNLITMTAVAANIAAGAIILPTYAGYHETWCGADQDDVAPKLTLTSIGATGLPDFDFVVTQDDLNFESSLCTFQGAMLQFGFLAAVFWWVFIAFNMCLELYLGKMLSLEQPKWKWLRFGIYNVLAWGIAFVFMVIPAAANKIEFSSGATYCFLTNEDDNAWSLPFWFLPVGISLLLGTTMFIMAMVRITILFVTIKKFRKLLFLYARLFVFIFLYLAMFVFIFAYYIQYAKDENSILDGYSEYYKCLLYGGECTLSDSVSNYDLVMLKGWAISSLGTLLFFVFFSWDVIKFYGKIFYGLFLLCKHRKISYAFEVLKLVTYKSSIRSITGTASLSITQPGGGEEMETDETEVTDDDDDDDRGITPRRGGGGGGDEEEEGGSSSSSSD